MSVDPYSDAEIGGLGSGPRYPDPDEVLRWALRTSALGIPDLFDNNPQDSAFVRGHQLACAQVLDVIENGWVNRRDPIDLYRDLGLTS